MTIPGVILELPGQKPALMTCSNFGSMEDKQESQ